MQYKVLSSAVDAILSRKTFAAHSAFFDVESTPVVGTHALVFRSEDKYRVGRVKKPADMQYCAYCFTDEKGAEIPYPVVTSTDYKALSGARDELIAFYTSTDVLSARVSKLGEIATAVLPLVMAIFGPTQRVKNGWKVGSYHAIKDTAGQRGNKRQLAEKVTEHHDDIKRQLAELQKLVKVLTSQQAAAPVTMSASTQATIDATVASAFEPVTDRATLIEELNNPADGLQELYSQVLEHVADQPSVEARYLEALEESDDTTEFSARIERILASRAVLA
jgi:hypothetical protein